MSRLSLRPSLIAVCIGSAIFSVTAGAQSPAPQPPPPANIPAPLALSAIPSTPAGGVLREWLESFNSGDSARIASFLRTHNSAIPLDAHLGFRRQTGGFDLLAIVRSEPRQIEFFVRERGGSTTAVGQFELPATASSPVVGPELQALGPNVPVTVAHIDAATRAPVVGGASALLDSFYVFPDVAQRMGDSARARLARGAYDGYDSGPTFALRLTDDFAAIAHDKHLNVRFVGRSLPPQAPDGATPRAPSAEEIASQRRQAEERNCSFEKIERLEGNIGYLKFNGFEEADVCAPTVAAAMTFLAGTRALIIDLRQNGGGSPAMVALVSSYLFDHRTHLNDLWTRRTNATEEFWTRDSVAGRRLGGAKPVYVLTSSRTFSGAEEFANNLKVLRRATIVGETTGGGAHPVRGRRIDEHFMIGVPYARAVNPITHTNWEGVGVEPDVKVPATAALDTTVKMLRVARP